MTIKYEVVVGNIGTVYRGANKRDAHVTYRFYVKEAKEHTGRAAGEDVTLFNHGEIVKQHIGYLHSKGDDI